MQYRKTCWPVYHKQQEAALAALPRLQWHWTSPHDGGQESATAADLAPLLDSEELPGSTVLQAADGSRQASARALREEVLNRPALLKRLKSMKPSAEAVQVGRVCCLLCKNKTY